MKSHVDKLFRKQKLVSQFVTVGVVVWRDDWCGTAVKVNDGGGWSSGGVVGTLKTEYPAYKL
jgi:hypothetical protein